MRAFTKLTSPAYRLLIDDIDTDQIIPARYLKVTSAEGLGTHLFADWRYLPDGSTNAEFELNREHQPRPQILIAGNNFGCGSSREHAPWALIDFGFKAIISTSFADIFRNNALKNGLLPVQLTRPDYSALLDFLAADCQASLTIDLLTQSVTWSADKPVCFPIDPFSKSCLVNGLDELGYLLERLSQIEQYEHRLAESRSGLK